MSTSLIHVFLYVYRAITLLLVSFKRDNEPIYHDVDDDHH